MKTFSAAQKLFVQVWGNSGQNPAHHQKFTCFFTYGSNYTHPQLLEQKGFRPSALDAKMRNTNAPLAIFSRIHKAVWLEIFAVLSVYTVISILILSAKTDIKRTSV